MPQDKRYPLFFAHKGPPPKPAKPLPVEQLAGAMADLRAAKHAATQGRMSEVRGHVRKLARIMRDSQSPNEE